MKFTAIPVKEGDSFLLQHESITILIDTGEDENECVNFLSPIIDSIDVVIITHYDSDHVNGLLKLLESKILVKEIWLPDNFGRIHETLNEEKNNLLKRIYNEEVIIERKDNNSTIKGDDFRYDININSEINENEREKVENGDISQSKNEYEYFFHSVTKNENNFTELLIQINTNGKLYKDYLNKNHLKKIENIVNVCKEKKIRIKWLRYTGKFCEIKIANSIELFALNCNENTKICAYSNDIDCILYLTPINIESLVFLYKESNLPNVLFSADSGFDFFSGGFTLQLADNSIITAPHHGSGDRKNARVYRLIDGNNLIFVRSDCLNKDRPRDPYLSIPRKNKFCTICNNSTGPSVKVELIYRNSNWNSNKGNCICT